jgi:hypothetical protein
MLTQLYMVLARSRASSAETGWAIAAATPRNSESGGNAILHSNFKKLCLVESREIGLLQLAQ